MTSVLQRPSQTERLPNKGFACKTKYFSCGLVSFFLSHIDSNCFKAAELRPKKMLKHRQQFKKYLLSSGPNSHHSGTAFTEEAAEQAANY